MLNRGLISKDQVIEQTKAWLKGVVIELGLCPFASRPFNDGTIHYEVVRECTEQSLLDRLLEHCDDLAKMPSTERETTLLILPDMLLSFDAYCVFIDWATSALALNKYDGIFQLASFHPDYCFEGVDPQDQTNLTNRAPYPILHLLREQSVEIALDYYGGVDTLIERNMQKMSGLNPKELKRLFPYLF